jgi:hypothetical protein
MIFGEYSTLFVIYIHEETTPLPWEGKGVGQFLPEIPIEGCAETDDNE